MTPPDPTTPNRISWLSVPEAEAMPEGIRKLWSKAEANIGFVPNVFRAQALNPEQFLAWWGYFNLLLNKDGHLPPLERELVAVVVSGANRCIYCAVSHGAALRELLAQAGRDPQQADLVAVNWRHAGLEAREAALCAYAERLTLHPAEVAEADLQELRDVGLDDNAILELVQVIGMFNLTNRVSGALGFVPNAEYHGQGR